MAQGRFDFANAIEGIRIGDGFPVHVFAKNSSHCNFRLLQHNLPCVDGSELARTFFTFAALVGAAMCSAFNRGATLTADFKQMVTDYIERRFGTPTREASKPIETVMPDRDPLTGSQIDKR